MVSVSPTCVLFTSVALQGFPCFLMLNDISLSLYHVPLYKCQLEIVQGIVVSSPDVILFSLYAWLTSVYILVLEISVSSPSDISVPFS